MVSWRDTASTQAQEDLDALLDLTIGFAQQQLASRGAFYPFAATIDRNGRPKMSAALSDADDDHPVSTDVIEACVAALTSERAQIRAGAVVADVRISDPTGDAIRVEMEHEDGIAMVILFPYAKRRRHKVEYGDMRGLMGTHRIWEGPDSQG